MRTGFIILLVISSALVGAPVEPPLVVAVDTSRSLRHADLAAVHQVLSEAFAVLPEEVPVGLIAFDDRARWLSLPGTDRAEILDDLTLVEPTGSYTVLYDALYLAAQDMEGGGVVLAISDGRDENSAVRVEDIESLCGRHDVRLLTAGIGRRVDERALRRLALLTRGHHVGSFTDLRGDGLSAALAEVRPLTTTPEAVPATGIPAASVKGDSPPEIVESGAKGQSTDARIGLWPLVVFPVIGLLFLAALGIWLVALRLRPRRCENCGVKLARDEADCSACEIERVREAGVAAPVETGGSSVEPYTEEEACARETIPDGIDRTMVLAELGVLAVREEGQAERLYTLPRGRTFAVGRAPQVNTIQVEDPTVSAQHFKVLFKEDGYYVVDLGATNPTTVNNERVRIRRLLPGDVIRAGLTEFEFAYHAIAPEAPDPEAAADPYKTAPPPLEGE